MQSHSFTDIFDSILTEQIDPFLFASKSRNSVRKIFACILSVVCHTSFFKDVVILVVCNLGSLRSKGSIATTTRTMVNLPSASPHLESGITEG
jgi:hypothetical protein